MTPKQILDSFSETLMLDERILSAQERTLLRNLIQHARTSTLEPVTYEAVNATIASAVGETVAQRAFSVLGTSIVERIVGSSATASTLFSQGEAGIYANTPPSRPPQGPPGPPGPPGSAPQGVPAKPPLGTPRPEDIPPGPPGSGPHGSAMQPSRARTSAVLEHPLSAWAQCVVLDEFLSPEELVELTSFALQHEADFDASQVVAGDSSEGIIHEGHRRSRVLMDLGEYRNLFVDRLQSALPLVLDRLGMEEFSIRHVEAQITASNAGDFFRCHSDNGDPKVASRRLTFVYFFHREPRPFSGGELRLYDEAGPGRGYHTIVPQQNQIVFFPCSLQHEITPVDCPSGLFADSRFTLNGWLHN
ncbi:MAG TPA: 2OG-Fe(II) oxygenase [Candidatus Sulfotelmatobacter sp.]